MADEDYLTEEEQAEALKQWFKDNWLWMTAGVVIALGLLAGWQRYQAYKVDRTSSAAQLLEQYAAAQNTDAAKAGSLLKQLSNDYSATPYADQAHLLAAKQAVQSGKYDEAVKELKVVMTSAADEQLRGVARVRLARVLIQQQKPDEALNVLVVDKAGAFAPQMHEVRGDALYAKGDRTSARAEYQSALNAYKSEPGTDTSLLQLKADELNSDAPALAQTQPAK